MYTSHTSFLLQVDELLPDYLEGYDIVLVKDETFDVPNGILKNLL